MPAPPPNSYPERAMKQKDGSTTSPSLLKRVADWADHPAWCDFFDAAMIPYIHSWCRGYGLDDSTHEDLCQQIWIELADRMRTYQIRPGQDVSWLAPACSAARAPLTCFANGEQEPVRFLADQPADSLALLLAVDSDRRRGARGTRFATVRSCLRQAEQVQHAVQQRVEPQTWQAFWRIAVDGCSVRETADEHGMSYAAAFAAHKRVARMLRAEGKRHLAERCPGVPRGHRAPSLLDARGSSPCPLALPTRLSPGLVTTRSTALDGTSVEAHVQQCESAWGCWRSSFRTTRRLLAPTGVASGRGERAAHPRF